MLIASVSTDHLQRQPAAALRRLLHPVRLPGDSEPPAEEHGVRAGPDQAAHLPREEQQPLPPPLQRVWLLSYGIASSIYRVFVGVMIILLVAWQVPVLGMLMALGGVVTWLIVPVGKVFKYLLRRRIRLWVAGCGGVIGYIPFERWMNEPGARFYAEGYREIR